MTLKARIAKLEAVPEGEHGSSLGNRLKQAREAVGLTLRQLADLVGKDHSTICGYENGLRTPRYDVIMRIARATCCQPEWLIGGVIIKGEASAKAAATITQGWQCPLCRTVWSPQQKLCERCGA